MQDHQKAFARLLADTGALFFAQGLRLKDGRPSPYFVNMGLFRTGRLNSLLGSYLAQMIVANDLAGGIDVILGPSYKGSALAVAAAEALWRDHRIDLAFEYDRKEAKTHGEASGKGSLFVTNALFKGSRVFIVDDVVTTMGTKYDILNLLKDESDRKNLDLKVVGVGLAVNREQTTAVTDSDGQVILGERGHDPVARFEQKTGIPVHILIGIRSVVDYLEQEKHPIMIDGEKRPLDDKTLKAFYDYLAVYGI
jgi:orotate phosphoribosyltransferase